MPDVNEVRELCSGSFEGTMRVRVGPISLNLTGTIVVEYQHDKWDMHANAQDRRAGGVRANIEVVLVEKSHAAPELRISADVQLMGRLGELGLPLIRRMADSAIQGFAENLKRAMSFEER